MPIKAPDPEIAADLAAIVGNLPGLELKHGRLGGGVETITVAWPGREIVMEKLIDDAAWNAFDPALDNVIDSGTTPADALRAALEHAYTTPCVHPGLHQRLSALLR